MASLVSLQKPYLVLNAIVQDVSRLNFKVNVIQASNEFWKILLQFAGDHWNHYSKKGVFTYDSKLGLQPKKLKYSWKGIAMYPMMHTGVIVGSTECTKRQMIIIVWVSMDCKKGYPNVNVN